MRFSPSIAVLLALAPGCSQIFGLDGPDRRRPDAHVDPPVGCTNDFPCPPSAPHCAVAQGYCVECLSQADCTTSAEPLCDLDTRMCQGCLLHSDCASGTCLPTGTCGSDAEVLWVTAAGTDNPMCSVTTPCKTINYALGRVTATRKYIRLSGALVEPNHVDHTVDSIWLADPGTTFTATNAPMIDVRGSRLEVHGLFVDCNFDNDRGFRVDSQGDLYIERTTIQNCMKLGVDVGGGSVTIERSLITNNEGGLETGPGPFSVTNTFFVRNGSNGAVQIESSSATNVFEYNTVVDNMANTGSTSGRTGGVNCPGTTSLKVANNIIARNTGYHTNTNGGCDFSASFVNADIAPLAFVSPDQAPFDYHIGVMSVARDNGTPSTLTSDFDGDARPEADGFDLGADEYKP